jgi:hypothetical protein
MECPLKWYKSIVQSLRDQVNIIEVQDSSRERESCIEIIYNTVLKMRVKSWIACVAFCVLHQSTSVLGANDTSSTAIINVNNFPNGALETSAWAIIV